MQLAAAHPIGAQVEPEVGLCAVQEGEVVPVIVVVTILLIKYHLKIRNLMIIVIIQVD